jgi:hypothetical protein
MDLAMDGAGLITTHIVKIAVVELSSDRPLGFTLSISAGRLMKGGGRAIPFQVTAVDHAAAPPTASAFTAPSGSLYTLAMGPGTYGKDLYIKYSAAALQDPGTYSASLELDVVDN